jgi:hypothetical protein
LSTNKYAYPFWGDQYQKEFIRIIINSLEQIRGKDIVKFNPSGALDDTLESCSYESVNSLTPIKDSDSYAGKNDFHLSF